MFFESKNTEGARKNINAYHIGVSRKKVESIALASTDADSSAASSKPRENIIIKIQPNILPSADVNM